MLMPPGQLEALTIGQREAVKPDGREAGRHARYLYERPQVTYVAWLVGHRR
jgi:hypothetical protein